jgi:hypothetical protein
LNDWHESSSQLSVVSSQFSAKAILGLNN